MRFVSIEEARYIYINSNKWGGFRERKWKNLHDRFRIRCGATGTSALSLP